MKAILLDPEDMHLLQEYNWKINQYGYAVADTGRHTGNRKILRLHRLVMNAKPDELIDHINRDKLDNRKCNLRVADKSTNGMNRPAQSNNKSGVKGVSWSKQKRKWRITCNVRGKQYHLGYAKTLIEAEEKYKLKIKYYHGEFSCV